MNEDRQVRWVIKRGACTVDRALACLEDIVRRDVEDVNQLSTPRFSKGNFHFESQSNESFKVYWGSSTSDSLAWQPAVSFRCDDENFIGIYSNVGNNFAGEREMFKVRVHCIAEDSTCLLKYDRTENTMELWQISQRALEHLFFDTRLE